MAKAYISEQLRQVIEEAARYRCGYCLLPQKITVVALQMNNEIIVASRSLWVQFGLWPPES